jgi:hypothetical protein
MGGASWVESVEGQGSRFCFNVTVATLTVEIKAWLQIATDE